MLLKSDVILNAEFVIDVLLHIVRAILDLCFTNCFNKKRKKKKIQSSWLYLELHTSVYAFLLEGHLNLKIWL